MGKPLERKIYQSPSASTPNDKLPEPQQAWFEDDETGYHAEIVLDGQSFRIREVSDAKIKAFSTTERKLQRALQTLAREQKAAQDAAGDDGLGDEAMDGFAARSDTLLARQFENADELLTAALVDWSLPRECNADNIRKLSKSARRRLVEAIGQRSTLGMDEQSFLAVRSRT